METHNKPLQPTLWYKTAVLLKMHEGESLPMGGPFKIVCLNDKRKTFDFHKPGWGADRVISMAYSEGVWYCATWDGWRRQWLSYDLQLDNEALFALAPTLKGLQGVHSYKTPGALIRRVLRLRATSYGSCRP